MQDFDLGIGDLALGGAGAAAPGGTEPSIWEARRRQITNMPPGPQKEAALAALLRDYEGERGTIDEDVAMGTEMLGAASPRGTHLGGRYATYVAASPLEHMASALRQYGGAKKIREAREARDILAAQEEEARRKLFTAAAGGGTKYGMYDRL